MLIEYTKDRIHMRAFSYGVEVVALGTYSAGPQLEILSDEQLAGLAGSGNEEAFSLLVGRCSSMIQAQARRYRGTHLDVEDLAQEGFLGLLSAVKTYSNEKKTSFRTYAAVCIRHRMISAVRRAGEEPPVPDFAPEDSGEPGLPDEQESLDPAFLLMQREDDLRLQEWLEHILTPLEKRVLFYHLSAYSYDEIAQKMAIGPKAVDNALQRIRRKLSKSPLPSL